MSRLLDHLSGATTAKTYVFKATFVVRVKEHVTFVVPGRGFRRIVENPPRIDESKVVASEDWGPPLTRFLRLESPFGWLRYVHGQRLIARDVSRELYVCDFSTRRARTTGQKWTTFDIPSDIDTGAAFGVVSSGLPYAYAPFKLGELRDVYSQFLIDEERVVGQAQAITNVFNVHVIEVA
ncbi:hypothetical protein K488DRAFT_89100 [Vararia minispora EC-137]|uniref:Uncharacterized protein n=1 Tax=Vararia minispora EC-137 TaxID=1314806 RepID=A0ACB8QB87_9AGAM|nr:hypothetical protein K488DRAFT_89100 [Vararia minispora EC-137]